MKCLASLPMTMLLCMIAGISAATPEGEYIAATFCEKYTTTCGKISAWAGCATDFANANVGKGDKAADSQACRLYHLGLAEKSADAANTHCPHASKDGGKVCVDNAANFCARYTATCGAISAWAGCATDFAKFGEGAGTTAADTQSCRLYHLSLAELSADGAKAHCPHASKDGGKVCVASPALDATNFCARFGSTCTYSNNKWADCGTGFKALNAGKGDKAADTQACRLYHLGLAEKSKAGANTHCPHANKDGGKVCVDNAANFCARYTATCGTISANLYAWVSCATDFADISAGSGNDNANTQACRQYHLSLAELNADGAKAHCPHASRTGGGVCDIPSLKGQGVTLTSHVSLIVTAILMMI